MVDCLAAIAKIFTTAPLTLFRSSEIGKIYDKWFTPLGAPMTETLRTAFAIQSLPE